MNLFDLSGRNALVLGAGGIGRAIALGLVGQGAGVAVADADRRAAQAVATEIGDSASGEAAVQAAIRAVDVVQAAGFEFEATDETSVQNLAHQVLSVLPRLDILVNAFGVTVRKPAEEVTVDDWQRVMDVNARGTFICCRVFGREMIAAGGGKIVNLSSVRGRYGSALGQAEYSASKGAVDSLTRSLAAQWAKYGVYVNAVAPTVVETPLTEPLLADPSFVSSFVESIPLGRWGQPEDVVGPAVFLASPASDFVTGQVVYVDGGLTARI